MAVVWSEVNDCPVTRGTVLGAQSQSGLGKTEDVSQRRRA